MFTEKDVARVHCSNGLPVALMLACYNGAFDFPDDCLAEKLVLQPGGPVAAVCSSRVAMPYGMSALSLGLIEEYFEGGQSTLGEMVMQSKRNSVTSSRVSAGETGPAPLAATALMNDEPNRNPHAEYRRAIRVLGETFSPAGDRLGEEAREHVHLFHLLGDPLLRMKRPETIELVAISDAANTSTVVVSGQVPHNGEMLLELEYARDRIAFRMPRRLEFDSAPRNLDEYQRVYRQANFRTVARKTIQVGKGPFEARLEIPDWARGRCVVRGFMAEDKERVALGASDIQLQRR
jgi:hypothetical protein